MSELADFEKNSRVDTISDLPEVVLEYIFSDLSPYKDLLSCRLVCRQWRAIVDAATQKIGRDFDASLTGTHLQWSRFDPIARGPAIASRFSHSACRVGSNLYVFGGCTASHTTFNDLWTFDLGIRQWKRLVTNGCYPQPKCCASLTAYDKKLILFGGWTCSSVTAPPHNPGWKAFNTVHEYDIAKNRWSLLETTDAPVLSGHSASILQTREGPCLVVFGGLTAYANAFGPTSKLWVLNLKTLVWTSKDIVVPEAKPPARYGHTQIVLDSKSPHQHHLLVIGGCGGVNMLYNDVWLLTVNDAPTPAWYWRQIIVKATDSNYPTQPQFSLHQACKFGNKIVILNKSTAAKPVRKRAPVVMVNEQLSSDQDSQPRQESSRADMVSQVDIALSAGPSSSGLRRNSRANRQKLLESLNRMEARLKSNNKAPLVHKPLCASGSADLPIFRTSMTIHVLDLSHLLTHGFVSWFPCAKGHDEPEDGPDNVILYTLVPGKNEAIMFGGVQKDSSSRFHQPGTSTAAVFNSIHVLSAKKNVI